MAMQLEMFETSNTLPSQMEMFGQINKAEIGKRMKLELGERIALLKQCMQIRDRLMKVRGIQMFEINRLINKLDVDSLLKLEDQKKYH